jgi:hypothetical protein
LVGGVKLKKKFWESITFWGALCLASEAALRMLQVNFPVIEPLVVFLGVFLTTFGIRKAMK